MGPVALRKRSDPVVTRLRDLARGQCDDREAVLLDGAHVVLEALRADVPVELIVATEPSLTSDAADLRQLWSLARGAGVAVYQATSQVMDAASPVKSPSGIVAVARWTPSPVDQLWTPAPALVLAGVDIQDPGNAGALIRCADGLDATGVVLAGTSASPAGWKALRGAMGSTFRMPVSRADVLSVVAHARGANAQIVAAVSPDVAGAHEIRSIDLRRPTMFLLGNEGAGLGPAVTAHADVTAFIAMRPGLDSFNVSVTAGLLLYEARRQRV